MASLKGGLLGAKAASNAKSAPKKKQTSWSVSPKGADEAKAIARDVAEMCDLQRDVKSLTAKQDVLKARLKGFGNKHFIQDFCATGVPPETPMTIVNEETGQSVTFVVQERTGSGLSDEQVEQLEAILGKDAATRVIYDETKFSLDPVTLSQPVANGEVGEEGSVLSIAEVLNQALSDAVEGLQKKGYLSDVHVENLLQVEQKRALRPGTIDQAAVICGQDTTKVEQFLDALGSSCTRYVKA